MTKLLDFSWARPGGSAIKKAGYAGVLRYVSSTTGKNLSSSELRDYQDNGLYVGIVFEDGARNALMGFEQGIIDAKKALSLCNSLGFVNMPIYFAVDFDTTPEQQTEIDQYFKGINSIIGVSRTGAYGSYYIMLRCKASGFVSWFWQTLAWSGGQVADFIHIYQNGQSAFGGGADVDEAKQDNWGQYIPEATPQIQEVVSTPETPPILPPETLVIPEVVPVTQSTPISKALARRPTPPHFSRDCARPASHAHESIQHVASTSRVATARQRRGRARAHHALRALGVCRRGRGGFHPRLSLQHHPAPGNAPRRGAAARQRAAWRYDGAAA